MCASGDARACAAQRSAPTGFLSSDVSGQYSVSTGIAKGHEGQPLVFGNTMYVVTPFPNDLIAVDLTKPGGAIKWIYQPHPDRRAVGIACGDVVNRGASFADGKIFSSIAEGRAHGMPSWQTGITADQTWKLVAYIKSLRTRNEPQAPPTE